MNDEYTSLTIKLPTRTALLLHSLTLLKHEQMNELIERLVRDEVKRTTQELERQWLHEGKDDRHE